MKSFQQLKSELDANKIQNLYIFTGDEREVMRKYIKRITDGTFVMKAVTFGDIISKLTFKSLIPTKQTFLLEDDNAMTEIPFKRVLEIVGKNTLILTFKSIDKRKKFFKDADKYITEFEKFTDSQLVQYVQKLMPDIPSNIAQVIARYCNNEVSRIELEVDKLKHLPLQYVPYAEDLTLELINELISPPAEDRIFEMIDAVAKQDTKRAFSLYHDLIELNESPIKIVSLLYTKFKQVFLTQTYFSMSNAEIGQKTGLNPYQIGYVRELCGKFNLDYLIQILQNIQETEVAMKTGKRDINLAMDNLLIDILS